MSPGDIILEFVIAHWKRLPKRPQLSEKHSTFADAILDILHAVDVGELTVSTDTFFTNFEDDEKDIGQMKTDRKNALQYISDELEKEVKTNLENGKIMHDSTLRFLIARIIKRNSININFNASNGWLAAWKRAHALSSRRITKFVATVRHKQRDELEQKAKIFVEHINQDITLYTPAKVFNADQSGFQSEMHTARTLARTGSKKVECTVQSVSATTHSFTVTPLISADGILAEKLFVTLQEKGGKFPAKGHFQAPNLIVTCHTSHIMTKNIMKEFIEKIVFDSSMPLDALLIVDSWASWIELDSAAIDSITPPTHNLKRAIIPPGCTGFIQPLDVGFFGGFKKVVKMITGHIQLLSVDFKVYSRDNILKVISLVYWQLRSPKLVPWVKYCWSASGYDVPRPQPFLTPAQHMFPKNCAGDCAFPGCQETSFIKCIYCTELLCFNHFVVVFHQCC
uniref:HTH CENPB-type domain-containing protein n=1 Tax=Caenorhabditis japonica TaxID=281687 RepID=A0A8R1HUJ0_CAEJA